MPHRTAPSVLFMEYISPVSGKRERTLFATTNVTHTNTQIVILHMSRKEQLPGRWAKLQGGAVVCVEESLNKLTLWQVNCSGEVLAKG